MCGRYQLKTEPDMIQEVFDAFFMSQHRPRYNIAPTQLAPILRIESEKTVIKDLRFGLIPSWSQSVPDVPLVNARSESVFEKPSFRSSMQFQRCLVLVSGYYEWQKVGSRRDPYVIRQPGHQIFTLAGIWASWQHQAQRIESFAILTRSAGTKLSEIHHRVPVLVKPSARSMWLDHNTSRFSIEALLGQSDDDNWQIEAVSARVNHVKYDDELCEAPRAVQQRLF